MTTIRDNLDQATHRPTRPGAAAWITSPAGRTLLTLVAAHALVDLTSGVWPIFKTLAGLDLRFAGLIATISTMGAMMMQPLFGWWSEHGMRRRFLVTGCGLACLSMLLGPIARYETTLGVWGMYLLLAALLTVVKIGSAMFHPAGVAITGNTLHLRRSLFVSLFVAVGMVGFACSQLAFATVYDATRGRTEWMLLPLGLVWLVIFTWCRPHETHADNRPTLRQVIQRLARQRGHLLGLYLILVCTAAQSIGLYFLLPELLQSRGYPDWLYKGGAMLLMVVGSIAMMIPAGYLADRLGRKTTLIVSLCLSLGAYYLLLMLPGLGIGAFCALAFVVGGCMGLVNPQGVALAQSLVPGDESAISGVMMGLAWAGGSLAPTLVGWLSTRPNVGLVGALAWLGLAMAFAVVLAVRLPRDAAKST